MKNIKKILIAVGIIILLIVGIFVIRKCTTKEVVVKSLTEKIYESDTVYFGLYNNKPIKWMVVEKDEKNHRALLLCIDEFDLLKFTNNQNDGTWKNSDLRDYLNGDFLYTAFSDSERNNILETPIVNSPNSLFDANIGQGTIDKIFIFNFDEIKKYFSGVNVNVYDYIRPVMWVKYYPNVQSNSNNIDDSYIQKNKNESDDLAIQASKVKCVTEYSKNTVVKNMDTVKFGSYPQSVEIGIGDEPIEWIVLEKSNNEMLLLSKYILDCKCFNDEEKEVTWETCTLRKWLNDVFYNYAFSAKEKEKIVKSVVENKDNAEYGRSGGNDTVDFVYLLSNDECIKFFGNIDNKHNNKRLATNATEYAKNIFNNGRQLYVKKVQLFSWDFGNSEFWLRSPAEYNYFGRVWSHGETHGACVNYGGAGVRPLIRVKY